MAGTNVVMYVDHGFLGPFLDTTEKRPVSPSFQKLCAGPCAAMERFPDSKEVQGAALSTIFPIQQTCQSIGNLEGVYFTNLVNANALQLVFAALENHSDDYHSVSGALTVFYNLACGDNEDQRIQKVVCSFLRARQTSILSLQEIQQNLIPTIS